MDTWRAPTTTPRGMRMLRRRTLTRAGMLSYVDAPRGARRAPGCGCGRRWCARTPSRSCPRGTAWRGRGTRPGARRTLAGTRSPSACSGRTGSRGRTCVRSHQKGCPSSTPVWHAGRRVRTAPAALQEEWQGLRLHTRHASCQTIDHLLKTCREGGQAHNEV